MTSDAFIAIDAAIYLLDLLRGDAVGELFVVERCDCHGATCAIRFSHLSVGVVLHEKTIARNRV